LTIDQPLCHNGTGGATNNEGNVSNLDLVPVALSHGRVLEVCDQRHRTSKLVDAITTHLQDLPVLILYTDTRTPASSPSSSSSSAAAAAAAAAVSSDENENKMLRPRTKL